jgi:hypothetical protein
MLYNSVCGFHYFGEIKGLHLLGSVLMMEAVISFETSASTKQTTRYPNPGENNMNL